VAHGYIRFLSWLTPNLHLDLTSPRAIGTTILVGPASSVDLRPLGVGQEPFPSPSRRERPLPWYPDQRGEACIASPKESLAV
jgi:hypothetical protein